LRVGNLFTSDHWYYSNMDLEPEKYCGPGDLLYAWSASFGPCIWTGPKAIYHYHIWKVIPGPELDKQYCYYVLRWVTEAVRASGHGIAMIHVTKSGMEKWQIPLPPLVEQRRIARILKEHSAAVERARAAAEAQLKAAKALPAAYLREAFEGDESRSWTSYRLGDLIERHNEIIHPGDCTSGEAEFVGLEHIEPNTGRRIGSVRIDLAKLTGRKPTFREGQIVYGYLRPYLNKVWIAEFDGCSSVDQFAFQVRADRADARFVAMFMRSDTFLRRSAVVTTTGQLPRIGIDEIMAVEIDLPPTVAEQARISGSVSDRLATAYRLTASCQTELAVIDAVPAALLRSAFQGRL